MHRLDQMLYYLRENPMLGAGGVLILFIVLFGTLGPLFVDTELARPLSTTSRLAPSWDHPFGTDDAGRDLLSVMIVGVPLTMRVGLLAGTVGLGVGIFLGFTSGYLGGTFDTIVRWRFHASEFAFRIFTPVTWTDVSSCCPPRFFSSSICLTDLIPESSSGARSPRPSS